MLISSFEYLHSLSVDKSIKIIAMIIIQSIWFLFILCAICFFFIFAGLLLPSVCSFRFSAVCAPPFAVPPAVKMIHITAYWSILDVASASLKGEVGGVLGLQPGAPHLTSSSFSWLERTVSVCGSNADFHQSCGVGLTDNQVRLISYILKSITWRSFGMLVVY